MSSSESSFFFFPCPIAGASSDAVALVLCSGAAADAAVSDDGCSRSCGRCPSSRVMSNCHRSRVSLDSLEMMASTRRLTWRWLSQAAVQRACDSIRKDVHTSAQGMCLSARLTGELVSDAPEVVLKSFIVGQQHVQAVFLCAPQPIRKMLNPGPNRCLLCLL